MRGAPRALGAHFHKACPPIPALVNERVKIHCCVVSQHATLGLPFPRHTVPDPESVGGPSVSSPFLVAGATVPRSLCRCRIQLHLHPEPAGFFKPHPVPQYSLPPTPDCNATVEVISCPHHTCKASVLNDAALPTKAGALEAI